MEEKVTRRPNLSVLALVSFIASFVVARTFTTLSPRTVMITGGLHIHHFWYGIAILAIGGWLGISYQSHRIDRIAAILFGLGGGLIGDEVGLLLTMGDYWTGLTYTLIMVFLAMATILILIFRYSRAIQTELAEFSRHNASLYFGVFVAVVSAVFIWETENPIIMTASIVLTIVACVVIVSFFAQRIGARLRKAVS